MELFSLLHKLGSKTVRAVSVLLTQLFLFIINYNWMTRLNLKKIFISMKRICIIKVGTLLEGFINVLTLGRGKDIAGWIALKLGYADCGCEQRKIFLDKLFGCEDGIKL